MKFVSLFSGIGGFDLGFERAGMECVAQVEIDTAASSVLARHFPTVQRFKDVRDVGRHNLPACDVLCGGFPCQDLSVAGDRAGLAGERSGLYFEFQRIIMELRPTYVVIENVPGLLSSNDGRDFAIVLGGLTGVIPNVPEDGWGNAGVSKGRPDLYRVAWRVLDAQYFGVAQRRRRVFIVASLGTGRCAEILFERDGGSGNFATSGETGQSLAATLSASAPSRRNGGSSPAEGHFIYDTTQITSKENGSNPQAGAPSHPLAAHQHPPLVVGTLGAAHGRNRGLGQENELDFLIPAEAIDVRNLRSNGTISGTLQSKTTGGYSLNYQNPILTQGAHTFRMRAFGDYEPDEHASAIKARDGKDATDLVIAFDYKASAARQQPVRQHKQAGTLATTRQEAVFVQSAVRRLTPVECERLQGFPDGWTGEQSDTVRYRQLGNAVAVPPAEWLARRIVGTE